MRVHVHRKLLQVPLRDGLVSGQPRIVQPHVPALHGALSGAKPLPATFCPVRDGVTAAKKIAELRAVYNAQCCALFE